MNSEFENHLQRQPLRDIPPHWRGRILAHAQPEAGGWRNWFWPAPRAWAVLGAAWVVIFILHLSTPDEPHSTGAAPPSPEAMQQEAALMAQLLGPNDGDDRSPALPAEPKPRSERERKQLIG